MVEVQFLMQQIQVFMMKCQTAHLFAPSPSHSLLVFMASYRISAAAIIKIPSPSLSVSASTLLPPSASASNSGPLPYPPRFKNLVCKINYKLCLAAASNRFPAGGRSIQEDEDEHDDNGTEFCAGAKFREAVALFNSRDYHGCHDSLEAIWNESQDPIRTLVHGILQCSVGFYHLFNQNHKGAMMEIGEGVCKLRKLNLESGPFHQFERDISAVLDFIYQTQLEFAACTDNVCAAMDQSETSYKLLGGYAAGQRLYWLEMDSDASLYIVYCPNRSSVAPDQPRVRLPILHATEEHLMELEYT